MLDVAVVLPLAEPVPDEVVLPLEIAPPPYPLSTPVLEAAPELVLLVFEPAVLLVLEPTPPSDGPVELSMGHPFGLQEDLTPVEPSFRIHCC